MISLRFRKRTNERARIAWAPRALAVISCALALLAAQPVMGDELAAKSRTVQLAEPGLGQRPELAWSAAQQSGLTKRIVRKENQGFSPARHLRVLATLEILQRLLTAELRPVERHVTSAFWLHPECVDILPIQTKLPQSAYDFALLSFPPPLPAERAFAIGHCLLAPPLS